MKVVVLGAGAVGSVLGGLLALQKHQVLLICRDAHANAISENQGLRLKSATGEYFPHLEAAPSLTAGDVSDDACIVLTVKSYDTAECVEHLTAIVPADIPIVCFQNGIANEDVVSERFTNVYGGVCRMTCSMIQAGNASFRRHGRFIMGRHPRGSDPLVRKLAKSFDDSGCQAAVSRTILKDKWLKLAVNTQSTFHAIIDPRDHDANEFFELKVGILEETRSVLKAHKVKPKSCDGKDPSIDELIDEFKKPRAHRAASGMNVRNSTWQNLYLQRDSIENEFFHEPIIELGRKYNLPVVYNEVALQMVQDCHAKRLGPGALRLSDVLDTIRGRESST